MSIVINDSNPIYNYDHPFNQTIINDNTVEQTVKYSVPDRVNYMCVFIGGKGRDNKLLKKTSRDDFINEYGKPDVLKYGQPILNAWASIVANYSHAYCMRVMPLDACYSNIIISVKYKETDEGLVTKIVAESVGGLNNKNQLQSVMDNKILDNPDAEGYKSVPLFGVVSQGRGKYGNSFRIRLTNIFSRRKAQTYRTYRLELLDVDEGNVVVEAFEGTLYDYAINGISYILSDVVDGEIDGSQKINVVVNEDAINKLYESYELCVPKEERVTKELFDPIYGINKDKTKQKYIIVETSGEGFIALDRLDGAPLSGGNDGSLETPPEGKSKNEVIDDLYAKAFGGELDKAILSPRRIPVKFILDAGYSLQVKKQLVQLGLKRYDALIYLDAGIISTCDEALTFAAETADLNYRIVSKSFQNFQIRDPYSGKRVTVTVTYDLANNLAKHLELYGYGIPYTGETYATLNGTIKDTLEPVIDESSEDIKEKLYDARLNYYEAVGEHIFARSTQQTAQDIDSDLSEESNMMVVLEIKDIAERETISRRYNFADAYDKALFTEILNKRIEYLKDIVRNINVYYSASAAEEARSILHCYVEVVFKSIFKSSIIEINVNKRV